MYRISKTFVEKIRSVSARSLLYRRLCPTIVFFTMIIALHLAIRKLVHKRKKIGSVHVRRYRVRAIVTSLIQARPGRATSNFSRQKLTVIFASSFKRTYLDEDIRIQQPTPRGFLIRNCYLFGASSWSKAQMTDSSSNTVTIDSSTLQNHQ